MSDNEYGVQDTESGFAFGIARDGDEGYIALGLDRAQAEYGAMLLNAGGIDPANYDDHADFREDVYAAVERDADGVFAAERPEWATWA